MTPIQLITNSVQSVQVYHATPHEVWKMRREYKYFRRKIQHEFRSAARITRAAMKFHGYQLHHVIPIEWGGDNSIDNLVAVKESVHSLIHTYIRENNKPLRIGEYGYRNIPVFSSKVLTFG